MRYRLVGIKKFIELSKPGTIFIPIFINNDETLTSVIDTFKVSPAKLYAKNWGSLHIFVDNDSSVTFNKSKNDVSDNYIMRYRYKITSRSYAVSRLYLIVDSVDDIPDYIDFECYQGKSPDMEFNNDVVVPHTEMIGIYTHYLRLSKREIKNSYKYIVDNICNHAKSNTVENTLKLVSEFDDNYISDIDLCCDN